MKLFLKIAFTFILLSCGTEPQKDVNEDTLLDENTQKMEIEDDASMENEENIEEKLVETDEEVPTHILTCSSETNVITYTVLNYQKPYPECRREEKIGKKCQCELIKEENGKKTKVVAYAENTPQYCKEALETLKTERTVTFPNNKVLSIPSGYTCE